MTKAEKKRIDSRISRVYSQSCHGIQIPIMEMSKIFKIGLDAVAAGADDDELGRRMRAYVDQVGQPSK
jgi:hypothetical protein